MSRNTGAMHHANLLIGRGPWALGLIDEADRTPGPDVRFFESERLTIDDVRTLCRESSQRPFSRPRRSFIIITNSILSEAQNALLKLFEDPSPDTVFYLVIPREDILLPTLRSRLNLFGAEDIEFGEEPFREFLKASPSTRLKLISEHGTDEEAWLGDILRGFELHAEKEKDPRLMREVLEVEAHLRASGASKKMLLEHLALSL